MRPVAGRQLIGELFDGLADLVGDGTGQALADVEHAWARETPTGTRIVLIPAQRGG